MRKRLMLLTAVAALAIGGCGGAGSSSVQAPDAANSAPATSSGTAPATTTEPAAAAGKLTLSWGPPAAATDLAGYRVYYSADSSALPFNGVGATQGASPVDASTQTSMTLTGLDKSRVYYFTVTAYDSTGQESGYSNIASAQAK